ncbi:hypothetical protein LI951_00895 [Enterococcus sp. BWT-B8]|uniref:hypothetical protein n=1 Tax=Enterococcus sp. BWT-B8 TaxID=2885157 RepID=UPI001E2C26F8|nr:hypothetical protein [Enterococcus sp. BWT-B8]MCB5950617.1 hypothetical protein [Enterococcus sp. BWT-B8]
MGEHENFKILLEKYQYGQLSEEEKQYVEEELKKAEAIQDYLFSLEDLPKNKEIPIFETEDVKHIQKVIQKKWLKQGIITGIIVLFILLGGYFLGGPLLNQLYFNPLKGQSENTYSDFELYERIKDSLSPDGPNLTSVNIQQTGIGTYQVDGQYVDVFRNNYQLQSITIKKDEIDYQPVTSYYHSFLPSSWISTEKMFGSKPNPDLAELKERINGMPKSSYLKIKLYFEPYKKVELNQVQSLVKQNELEYVLGAGILSTDYSYLGTSNFGLNFGKSYLRIFNQEDAVSHREQLEQLNEKYPELFPSNNIRISMDSDKLEQHYLSMLSYLIDQEELGTEIEKVYFPQVYNPSTEEEKELYASYPKYIDSLKEAKTIVEKNGLIVSTLTIVIQPYQFESLIDDEIISGVGLEGVEIENNFLWSDL